MQANNYTKEKCFIAKTLGVKFNRIEIDSEHPTGFITIFIDGVYHGYVDELFYRFTEHGIDEYGYFREWVNDLNNKRALSACS